MAATLLCQECVRQRDCALALDFEMVKACTVSIPEAQKQLGMKQTVVKSLISKLGQFGDESLRDSIREILLRGVAAEVG